MDNYITLLIGLIGTLLGSSGMWKYMESKNKKQSALQKMILGLGHDRIMFLAFQHINKGYIDHDDYENLTKYLFKPYKAMGGNGTAERMMKEVDKLPITNQEPGLYQYVQKEEEK